FVSQQGLESPPGTVDAPGQGDPHRCRKSIRHRLSIPLSEQTSRGTQTFVGRGIGGGLSGNWTITSRWKACAVPHRVLGPSVSEAQRRVIALCVTSSVGERAPAEPRGRFRAQPVLRLGRSLALPDLAHLEKN